MTKRFRTGMILDATLPAAQLGIAYNHKSDASLSRIEKEVRREIVTLPFYRLFDTSASASQANTVTLMGNVMTSHASIVFPDSFFPNYLFVRRVGLP